MTFLVWGGGGHGRVVGDLIRAAGHKLDGFVDSDPDKLGQVVEPGGGRVIHSQNELLRWIDEKRELPAGIAAVALGIGDNRTREACLRHLPDELEPPALVHPSATVSASARIGGGTVVFAHAVVNAGARIERAVIVNSGAIVEHDCIIHDGAHVSPGAVVCGGVQVGQRSWIGAGATLIPGIVIGGDAMVAAGATVITDVRPGDTVAGTPAGSIRHSRGGAERQPEARGSRKRGS